MLDVRGTALSEVDKGETFSSAVAEAFTPVPASIAAGTELRDDLAAENGGWQGGEMPWSGYGTFTVVPGTVAAPEPARREISVLVRAEDGIPVDPAAFAKQVMEILNDPRGWGPVDGVTFSRTDVDAEADIVLTLASPASRNAMSAAMRDALYEALANVLEDPSEPRLILKADGRCFSTGGALAEFGSAQDLASAHFVRTARSCARAVLAPAWGWPIFSFSMAAMRSGAAHMPLPI